MDIDAYFDDLDSCSLASFLLYTNATDRTKAHSLYKDILQAISNDSNISPERREAANSRLEDFKTQRTSDEVKQYWINMTINRLKEQIDLEQVSRLLFDISP
ncbi:hypothetical protein BC936DRAFT_145926 [Jimgerdemannia flammicorona]|uniref:Uncharacterized protein n=1 Tax=Jimgerdemannia flammicorona TaxID=994334 RepID=A0A433D8U9_9FUNG|nr:hypothetical protein BC936DRAFT_145926 [Jimgerdemannia flammicorona]